jgi:hypothetical protein
MCYLNLLQQEGREERREKREERREKREERRDGNNTYLSAAQVSLR